MEKGLTVGVILLTFITVLCGVILFQAIEDEAAKADLTIVLVNQTVTAPAVNGISTLTGQELMTTPVVANATDGTAVPTTNYTIYEGVSTTTGTKRVLLKMAAQSDYAGEPINLSYTYGVEGYADDAGARAVIPLIGIFTALAIVVVALYPTLQSKLSEWGK